MNGVRTIWIELHYLIELDGGFVFKRHIDHDQLGKCEIHHINVTFKFHLQNEANDKPLREWLSKIPKKQTIFQPDHTQKI